MTIKHLSAEYVCEEMHMADHFICSALAGDFKVERFFFLSLSLSLSPSFFLSLSLYLFLSFYLCLSLTLSLSLSHPRLLCVSTLLYCLSRAVSQVITGHEREAREREGSAMSQ